jgi:hypothetical protein
MVANDALESVGDKVRGQWIDDRPAAFHLRRRLSETEERITGPVVDVRGLADGIARIEKVKPFIPRGMEDWYNEELICTPRGPS